jgi:hypothetical protein
MAVSQWTPGDVSASQTLTDNDHLYPGHINELRTHGDNWVNVKKYGAVGDGTTDDTTAIQNAINAVDGTAFTYNGGGTVIFPQGNYKITSALTINGHYNITLQGYGMARIHNANTSNGHAIVIGTSSEYREGYSIIRDLWITGNANSGYGVYATKTTNLELHHVNLFYHGYTALRLDYAFTFRAYNCDFAQNEQHGAYLTNISGNLTQFYSCQFNTNDTAGYAGARVEGASLNVSFIGCDFTANDYGLDIRNTTNANVIGCYFEATASTTRNLYAGSTAMKNLNLIGNYFQGAAVADAVDLDDVTGVVIVNNHFNTCNLTTTANTVDITSMNNTTAGGSTILDPTAVASFTSTTKGLAVPRMTTTQRDAITSPATGLVIYNTSTNKLNVRVAAAWEAVTSA